MNFDHDIIIVGAGPAGLNAGHYAAKSGAKVLILDKKDELGRPVRCAEAIIESIIKDSNIDPKPEFISNYINNLMCVSSKGKIITVKTKLMGYVLDRVKFEQYLGRRAEKNNAEIQLRRTVIGFNKNKLLISKNNGKSQKVITGKIIIAADGVESRIARWGGIDTTLKINDIAVCFQYHMKDIEVDARTVEFYWGQKYSPHGYIWIFPKSENSANVGIASIGKNNYNLKILLKKFLASRSPKSKIVSESFGCIPQCMPPKPVVKNNLILIGDAGRVAIPVTGAGIGNAMLTGKWAGNITGEIITNNLNLNELYKYEKLMDKIRKKIKRANLLKQKIINDDNIFNFYFALLAPIPYIYKLSPKLVENFLLKNIRY